MKYIAVIEIPDEYLEEDDDGLVYKDLTLDWQARGKKENIHEMICYDEDTPLRPLPEKAAVDESMLGIGFDDFNTIYYLGFNECIDKITGETE